MEATAQRQAPIRRVAVLVCTRERMEPLSRCLASIAALRVPPGVGLSVAVADNNPEPAETQIREIGAAHALDILYGHEPERGYSSVRNRAIDLALEAGADVMIFIDEDSTALPDLVVEHLAALERYGADAIVGSFAGLQHRAREGRRLAKAGTGNVAVRRWLVDAERGAGLRFDPRLNLLGFEDHEFFRDVTAVGGVIVRSARPLARDERSPGFAVPPMPATAQAAFAAMEGRNEIVAARIRGSWPAAVARLALRMTPQLVRGATAYAESLLLASSNRDKACARRERARLHFVKVRAAFGGVTGPGYDRPASKTGRLIEVAGTGTRD